MSYDLTISAIHHSLSYVFYCLDTRCLAGDEYLHFRPSREDAWTALEHLEHAALVNHYLLIIVKKGVVKALRRAASMPVPEGESDLGRLAPVADPDCFPWPAPKHMLPTGTAPVTEVQERLRRQGEECLSLLGLMANGEGALQRISMSVNNLGKMDMYEWLYFIAQHGRYHLALLERLDADRR